MARFDIPIDGVNEFQYRQAKAYLNSINIDEIEVAVLAYLDTLTEEDYKLTKKELARKIRDELRDQLIIVSNYDVQAYIDDWSNTSENFIKKLAIGYLLLKGWKKLEAREAIKDGHLIAISSATFFGVRESQAILESLKARTLIKLTNNVVPYAVKKSAEKVIRAAIQNKLVYQGALYDQFSTNMSTVYNNIYDGYSSLGLWPKHRWQSFRPQDWECQIATDEVVEVGRAFSNGLVSPPVHDNCFCILIPSD